MGGVKPVWGQWEKYGKDMESYIKDKTVRVKKLKKKILKPSTLDAIKAMRRGGREAEMELLGPGFHSHNRVHKSEKIYTRKKKHKGGW